MPNPKDERSLEPLIKSVKKALSALKENQLDTEATQLEEVLADYEAICFSAHVVRDDE